MPPIDAKITAYADWIMTQIDADIAAGLIPARVRTFAQLRTHLAKRDYLHAAGVPHDATEVIAAVQRQISRRLAEPGRPICTYDRCRYPKHDHTTTVGPDGEALSEPIPLRCAHCHEPANYDEDIHEYQHDDPAAPDCFLIRAHRW